MDRILDKKKRLAARKRRIRMKIKGTAERPRVSVYISNQNIVAQMIDDETGKTVVSVSTLGKGSQVKGKSGKVAAQVGMSLAEKAQAAGVTSAVLDRNGRLYHGKVKEFADAMREKGMKL